MGEKCCQEKMSMPEEFMQMADDAWAELLKDKMKAIYEKERGKNMDEVANICVKNSLDFWKDKMKGKSTDDVMKKFEEDLMKVFSN